MIPWLSSFSTSHQIQSKPNKLLKEIYGMGQSSPGQDEEIHIL